MPPPPVTASELAAVPLFAGLPPALLASAAARLRAAQHPAGATVIAQGDGDSELGLLLAGELLAVRYGAGGQEVGYRRLLPGAHYGELAAIGGGPRSVSLVALTAVRVASLPGAAFRALVAETPALAMRLLEDLAERVRELSDRLFEARAIDTRGRLAAQLVRLALTAGAARDGGVLRPAPTHAELAALIGGQRETVTRLLGQLASEGLIARAGRGITVRDIGRLAALADA